MEWAPAGSDLMTDHQLVEKAMMALPKECEVELLLQRYAVPHGISLPVRSALASYLSMLNGPTASILAHMPVAALGTTRTC